MITRTARARYEGMGKDGKGWVSTQSGVLADERYGFNSRFEDGPGTNPEELIAAAHAGCFTMALSFALAGAGATEGTLETTARVKLDRDGDGFTISRSDLELTANVPGLDEARLKELAEGAKANCPVSKLIRADMRLTVKTDLRSERQRRSGDGEEEGEDFEELPRDDARPVDVGAAGAAALHPGGEQGEG